MPQQREMFASEKLTLEVPEGITEPRLWVRRLKIWEAPGGNIIRDIGLRPGLNIIWSPDGDDDPEVTGERSIGHGSGKTLFCRLLRYCLGETRFADEIQRDAISSALLNGIVGAEVMLDGICWAVVRPLGIGRKHFAVSGGVLDEVAKMDGAGTGIDPLIDAIETSILTDGVAKLSRLAAGQKAWPVALAWLARDQECRFDDVLDWRSPSSGSDAPQPASGDTKGPRLQTLRAFLAAITEEEQACREREQTLSSRLEVAKKQRSFLEWDQKRRLDRLINGLNLTGSVLPEMPLLLDQLKGEANQRLADASELPSGDKLVLGEARKAMQEAQSRFRETELKATRLNTQLPLQEALLRQIGSEIPGLSSAANAAASPVCPICEVPIDAVLADRCKLSHKVPDAAQCRARLDAKRAEISEQERIVSGIRTEAEALKPELALALQAVQQSEERVRKLETAADLRTSSWRAALRLVDDAQRVSDISEEQVVAKDTTRKLDDELQKLRDGLRGFEDKQAKTFSAISEKFSVLIFKLLGENAKGSVRLKGKGLEISIEAGGDRRTAAIETLKVLTFDFACLCLSMEGRTRVPAFLVHDSPREADLGLTIYDEYFRLLRQIEDATEVPVFQYIVTTTTRPPEELNRDPWRCAILRGEPGSERLLRRNL
jgi:hypothetical protein